MEDAKALGEAQIKKDGTMTFDYFLQTSILVNKHTNTMIKDGQAEGIIKRRELLRDEQNE